MNTVATTRNGKTTPFGEHGKLQVKGKNIIDANGNICQLRGISTHSLAAYPEYVTNDVITQLVDEFNITVFRLAMYSAEADGFKGYADGDDANREALEKLIIDGVKICAELGIYVLVDWHILFDYDPNTHTDSAIKFFKKMVAILKDYDNVIYEICNEPNMDTTWEQITNYANQVIPVIQEIDSEKIIVVGTPVWSQRVDEAADKPLRFENIIYTLHFYSDTHRDDIRGLLTKALSKDLPVFVTEFGICDAQGSGPINDEQTDIWLKMLNDNNISYILWNLSNKNETSAILKPDCTKTSNFTDDDLSGCGLRLKKYMTL